MRFDNHCFGKTATAAALSLVAMLAACGVDGDLSGPRADTEGDGGSVSVKIAIPKRLTQSLVRVEYVVVTAEEDTLRGTLPIEGNVARGTITAIPPGDDLLFVLIAYDASGEISHSGSARADIAAGRTAQVRIQLQTVTGGAVVIGDFGEEPLFPKAQQLPGTWRLNLATDQGFDFSYTFRADGLFTNRISGAFLSALTDLEELDDLDLGQLDRFDGGTLILSGTWRPGEQVLDLDFDQLQIELSGELPLLGNVEVEILEEDLGDGAEFDLSFGCNVTVDELRLRGAALTLGVPLAVEDAADAEYPGVSGIGRAGVEQLGAMVGALIRDRNLDEVILVRE